MMPENGAQSYRDDGRLAENANFMILQERVRPPVQAAARLTHVQPFGFVHTRSTRQTFKLYNTATYILSAGCKMYLHYARKRECVFQPELDHYA